MPIQRTINRNKYNYRCEYGNKPTKGSSRFLNSIFNKLIEGFHYYIELDNPSKLKIYYSETTNELIFKRFIDIMIFSEMSRQMKVKQMTTYKPFIPSFSLNDISDYGIA